MHKIINFLSDILMSKKDDCQKIGLAQFKTDEVVQPLRKKEVSIRTKDVKLSDLMRRAS